MKEKDDIFFYILVHSITIAHLILIQHEHRKVNNVTNISAISIEKSLY